MNLREFQVLDGLNIASTRHSRHLIRHGFECTAAQLADVMVSDPRFGYDWATPRSVGAVLRGLARSWPHRREPLVEKVDSRRWHLTDAGVRVLSA